jgi:uncharacterized RmlC-like cupin family protein
LHKLHELETVFTAVPGVRHYLVGGTSGLSSILIVGDEDLILIDATLPNQPARLKFQLLDSRHRFLP